MKKSLQFVTAFLIIMLGVLNAMITAFDYGNRYGNLGLEYAKKAPLIGFVNVPSEKRFEMLSELLRTVDDHHAVVVRSEGFTSEGGDHSGRIIAFYGDVQAQADKLKLDFLGAPIFTAENLDRLMKSEPGKTLGFVSDSKTMLEPLPSIKLGEKIVGIKLIDFLEDPDLLNGQYRVFGLNQSEYRELANRLASIQGVEVNRITDPLSGEYSSQGTLEAIAFAIFAVTTFLVIFMLVMIAIQNFKHLGIHLLVGWSRLRYVIKITAVFFWTSFVSLPILAGVLLWDLKNFSLSTSLVVDGVLRALMPVCTVAGAIALTALLVFSTKPVNAIRNRISIPLLMGVSCVVYILTSIGFVVGIRSTDMPYKFFMDTIRSQQIWNEYADYKVLNKEEQGDDLGNFIVSDGYVRGFYEWYKSIEHEPGVYLSKTYYRDRNKDSYLRDEDTSAWSYWSFKFSPSMVHLTHFPATEEDIQLAESGVKVFYIPSTWPQEKKESAEEEAKQLTIPKNGPITTKYMEDPRMEFREYTPNTPLFTWASDPALPTTVVDPVVQIVTTANMVPYHDAVLGVRGLNSPVKLASTASNAYLTPGYFAKFGLDDNKLDFAPVSEYIQSQRELYIAVIVVFCAVSASLIIVELLLIFAILRIFALTSRERIAVMALLGRPLSATFVVPYVLVGLMSVGSLIAALILKSEITLIAVCVNGVVQLLMLVLQSRALSKSQVSSMLKSV